MTGNNLQSPRERRSARRAKAPVDAFGAGEFLVGFCRYEVIIA